MKTWILWATGGCFPTGLIGTGGSSGTVQGLFGSADFYALIPNDITDPIVPGESIKFPNGEASIDGNISRSDRTTTVFQLAAIGTYLVQFQVAVSEAGQLCIALNNTKLSNTVVGRNSIESQIIGVFIVKTTVINSLLKIVNNSPEGSVGKDLTITPYAGNTINVPETVVTAHLVITQLN